METFTPLRIGHVSDTHLGYEAFQARTDTGHNQRGADIVAAFHEAVGDIVTWDPPLVVHSGDLFEAPTVPVRYLLAARYELTRLAGRREDGTRRAVVVISGNHDTSRNRRDGCQLDLFRGQPGLRIVSFGYEQIRFDPADGYDPALANVVIHALPHDTLKQPEVLADVRPVEGHRNILVTHGVAEGDDTFRRMIGREFPVPEDLLVRGWDYVALGHWHTQGPVKVAGDDRFAFYAGSTECIDFSDLRGKGSSTERAWLAVTVDGERPAVTRRTFTTRRMLALDPIDASDMTSEEVAAALYNQLDGSDPDDAIVRQRVTGLTRDLWALVDLTKLRERASVCMNHRVEAIYKRHADNSSTVGSSDEPDLGDLESILVSRAEELIPEGDRPRVIAAARAMLGSALGEPVGEQPTDPTPDVGGNSTPRAATPAAATTHDAGTPAGNTAETAKVPEQRTVASDVVDAAPAPDAAAAVDTEEPAAPAESAEPDVELGDDAASAGGAVEPTVDIPDGAADIETAAEPDAESSEEVNIPAPPEDPAATFAAVLSEFDSLGTLKS